MKLLTFKSEDENRLGIRVETGVIDVQAAAAHLGAAVPDNLSKLFESSASGLEQLQQFVERAAAAGNGVPWLLTEDSLEFGPCVPDPGKIICIGLNYRRHAAESGMAVPQVPVIFSKFNNTLAANGESIPLQPDVIQYDYEAELCAVIGREARNVTEAAALDYVFGYCNANDLSARDLQMLTGQWLIGKTLDKFLPLGPYLVTADEIPDPQNLGIRCWLNGELRQNSNTSDMVFSVAQLISYVSRYVTLKPGDLISTGTPEGVILGMENKVWLKPGDEVVVELDGLGRLVNTMTVG
jgi:2-keto-4-pentenoate hydratase/2-oxohepta-3-ene-1,7-dioic acid hydratase in catechol pathway